MHDEMVWQEDLLLPLWSYESWKRFSRPRQAEDVHVDVILINPFR